jgi:hypothetical protein
MDTDPDEDLEAGGKGIGEKACWAKFDTLQPVTRLELKEQRQEQG